MTDERKGVEEPPILDADDEAILARIHDERGIAEGVRARIDRRGVPDVPLVYVPPRYIPPPRRR